MENIWSFSLRAWPFICYYSDLMFKWFTGKTTLSNMTFSVTSDDCALNNMSEWLKSAVCHRKKDCVQLFTSKIKLGDGTERQERIVHEWRKLNKHLSRFWAYTAMWSMPRESKTNEYLASSLLYDLFILIYSMWSSLTLTTRIWPKFMTT